MSLSPWQHDYRAPVPADSFELLTAEPGPPVESEEFLARLQRVGACYRRAGIRTIWLAHGTFAGSDAGGIAGEIDRYAPAWGDSLRKAIKQLIDALARDVGNFPPQYAQLLERGLNAPGEAPIAVRRFHWSSQNHHLGRADGAIRFLDAVAESPPQPGDRVLFWGHSHAGNVAALVTHLLSGDRTAIRRFFRAARPFYRGYFFPGTDVPRWPRVRALLRQGKRPLHPSQLDIVTLGTPVRYTWNQQGYGQLLHVVHHVPTAGTAPHCAPFPPAAQAILSGNLGDVVQQVGISGTNVPPQIFAWRNAWAEWRLNRLLQRGVRARDLWRNLQPGRRVPDAGHTLLIDYRLPPASMVEHLAGHAVYTRLNWMLYHAELVANRLYGLARA